MVATTAISLVMAMTVTIVSPQTDLKQRDSHTQRQSYFDEISRVNRLSQQRKYFESVTTQRELNKISETMLGLSFLFNKQSQKKQATNLLHSSGPADEVDVQKMFISALHTVAASSNSSSTCASDAVQIVTSLFEGNLWGIQFLDAFGKPGPGLTQGRLNFVGSYGLCRSASSNGTRIFHGNYCTLKVNIGPASPLGQLAIQLGACLPDTCSEAEITLLVAEVIQQLNLNRSLEAGATECHTDKRDMTTATVVSIVVVVVIALLMIFGTSFDIIFIQWPKWMASSYEEETFITNGLISQRHGYSIVGEDVEESKQETKPLISNVNVKGDQQGICTKVLLAFSIYTNGSKVLDTKQPSGSLSAIHGIRFLSMSWVLLGHTYVFGLSQFANVASELPALLGRWTFDAIANALVSVDTFFALSGLLTAYLLLIEIKKKGLRINWPLFYFHRFWRLTPPYMLTILVVLGFQQYLGSGALWPSVQPLDKENCENYWWTNLLYVNNLVHVDNMCFGHSWYMANDMQFFILSPLMIMPFFFHTYIGVAACVGFLLICWISVGVLSTQNDWTPSIVTEGMGNAGLSNWFKDYYITPWCRIGAYVIGVLAGSFLALHQGKIRMNWCTAWIGWIIATASGLAVVYGIRGDISDDNISSIGAAALYNAVARSVWAACVCWVIIACVSGYGGFVNSLLSWSPFIVLGRLTYMAYLIHPCLMYVYFQNQEQLYYLTDTTIVVTYCGFIVITNIVAFVLMLAFESPWIGLERTFLRKKQKE